MPDIAGLSAPDDPGAPGGEVRTVPPTEDPTLVAEETAEGMPQPSQPYELHGGISTPTHPGVKQATVEKDPAVTELEQRHGMGSPPTSD